MPDAVLVDLERRIRDLESERMIRKLIHQYADAADRKEWDRWREIFHEDSLHRHDRMFEGTSLEFSRRGEVSMSECSQSHHFLGNVVIEVAGDQAKSQCYVISHMTIPAEGSNVNIKSHHPGVEEYWIVGGRYFDNWECRDGRWGITRRLAVHDWEQWSATDARGFRRQTEWIPGPI